MNDLLVFYLYTAARHVTPLVLITLCLRYGTPMSFLQNILGERVNRGLRRIGITRFEELSRALDADIRDSFTRFTMIACVLELTVVIFITLAIAIGVPLPFVASLNEKLPKDVIHDLLMFSTTAGILQMMPIVFLVMALLYDIPLPFMPTPSENHATANNNIVLCNFRDFDSYSLTRFESSTNIFFHVRSSDNPQESLVVWQKKEENARTECYFHDNNDLTWSEIAPPLFTVSEMEEIFNQSHDE